MAAPLHSAPQASTSTRSGSSSILLPLRVADTMTSDSSGVDTTVTMALAVQPLEVVG